MVESIVELGISFGGIEISFKLIQQVVDDRYTKMTLTKLN